MLAVSYDEKMDEVMRAEFERIGVAGDWHGDTGWAKESIQRFSEAGVAHVLHVGDFGFWPGNSGKKYLHKVNKSLAMEGVTLYVTLGNHEDYVQVSVFTDHPEMPGFVYNPDYSHILVAKRGARWVWNGVSFVSLGGANSINFTDLREGFDWWREERITLGDVYNTVAGGHADIMVSHDCPLGVNILGSHRDADGWNPEQVAYAQESRLALRQAVDGVKPGILFHGHYHVFRDLTTELNDGVEDYSLRSVGLDMNGHEGNLLIYTLSTGEFSVL